MNAKFKCSARIIGTPHGVTLSKPEHNHEPIEFPGNKYKMKTGKYRDIYTSEYVVHE